ncbi:MAG: YkvA family protein, partial [Anaerolineales bacterium]
RTLANLLVLIPDMLALLLGLARDARVPTGLKAQIALAIAYVLAPIDLMPEAVLGVLGLADDATVMVVLISAIRRFATIDPAILRAHWRGQQSFDELMDEAEASIREDGDEFLQNGLLGVIEKRFSEAPADDKRA